MLPQVRIDLLVEVQHVQNVGFVCHVGECACRGHESLHLKFVGVKKESHQGLHIIRVTALGWRRDPIGKRFYRDDVRGRKIC